MNDSNRPSLRLRWMIWRARFSMPVLLSFVDERKLVPIITGVNCGLLILTISLFAWLTNLPLVFPTLGPSTFLMFSAPLKPAAAPRSVILGHWVCLATGLLSWHLFSVISGTSVSVATGGWALFGCATLTLGVCSLLLVRLSCPHPPACASGLVVALGAAAHWYQVLMMAGIIAWLTYQAVLMNRLAGIAVPLWGPRDVEGGWEKEDLGQAH